jgi:Na+-transporting NADH:ubiquinone oxidoreductase subunit F
MMTIIIVGGLIFVIAVALLVAERLLISHAECTVTVNGNRKCIVESGDTLLSVLNRQKLFVPSACGGKATCGLCKVSIVSGGGGLLPAEKAFVTRAERERGIRLACQVRVQNDIEVRLPESMLGAREYEATVDALDTLTHDTRLLRIGLRGGRLAFRPGQYIQLLVPGTDQFRAYSIASPPAAARDSGYLELIVRHIPGGLCTGWIHRSLRVGDKVRLTGPFGDFFLATDEGPDIIALGRSTGMAPMRSIIMHLAELGMPRGVSFFFGARSARDLYFADYFRSLEQRFRNFRFVLSLSRPRPEDDWRGEVGYPAQILSKYVRSGRDGYGDGSGSRWCSDKDVLLCGPPVMIDQAMEALPRLGVPADRIFFDKF